MVKSKGTVLVCVTGQRDCDRLIRAGRQIAQERSIPMQVLCVQPMSSGFETSCEELEYLRQTARDASADKMCIRDRVSAKSKDDV